ncbi:uncharacterized protein LOC124348970 isoform X2 [Daphnia pulicaria]|uniref:uncharacterized protein LOC124348970 isoform X2 n=1 Tax=Daphnia pulicaria TaxID=35523 RepID=UPI001EECB801|nr:uncharacterized protein LOC124348970 isoform X2 [Daphnia pulicaria]
MGPHKYRRNLFFDVFNGRSNYIDLGLCITARPAPRTARPLAGLPNPYPYGCSVLCNHPKDPELKDVVWRPRISSTHEGGAEHYENAKMMKRANRAGLPHDERSIFHHNWEQKIISNALGSYAETGRAYPTTSSANQLAIRRCASGGPSPVERRSHKTEGMLVLDLRPWKSFDNVSSIADGQHEPLDNFERFELKSPRTRMQDKPGRSTRPIRRPETFLSKSFKESKKVPKQSSSKGARSLRNPDTSVLDENVFTGYDANNLSDPMREMDLSDGFPLAKTEDEPVFLDPKLNGAFINEVGAQPPIEVCEEAVKNKQHSVEDLEESLRNLQVEDYHNGNNDVLYQVEGTVAVEDMSWLYFPRAGNNFGARFELPIDLRKLKTMTPLEYLSQYVVATRCRQRLNDVVFERHATESKLSTEKLFLSLTEILGFHLDSQAEEKLSELIDLVSVSELTREQFAGIGALAERIGRSGISRRDDLELADFDLLHKKMSYLEMSQFLRRLFLFISEIEDLV